MRLIGTWAGVVALVALSGWLYWRLVDAEMVGFIQDDGLYLVTSKALAEGEGFRLLHLVGEPAHVKHPVGYPAALAVGWLINPVFPDNLPLLRAITLTFSMAALLVVFGYLAFLKRLGPGLSVIIVSLVVANIHSMVFLTSIMSEGPYLFWSFLTLCAMEMYRSRRSVRWLLAVVAGSALTFHTRLFGITLLGGLTTWFLLQKERRHAWIYVASSLAVTVLPWMIWTRTHQQALTSDNFMQVFPTANYVDEIANYLADGTYLERLWDTGTGTIKLLLELMFLVLPNLHVLLPQWLGRPAVAGSYAALVSFAGYGLAAYFIVLLVRRLWSARQERAWDEIPPDLWYVLFYVGLMVVWSYARHQARFFLMILPLLWSYFLSPFVPVLRERGWRAFRWTVPMAALIFLGLAAAPWSYFGIWHRRTFHYVDMGGYPTLWNAYRGSFAFIREHLPADAVVATNHPAVYYLYTGRRGFHLSSDVFAALLRRYSQDEARDLMGQMDAAGVTHLITDPHMVNRIVQVGAPIGIAAQSLLERHPKRFSLLAHTQDNLIRVYRVAPATE
jgi:hypothetical protein